MNKIVKVIHLVNDLVDDIFIIERTTREETIEKYIKKYVNDNYSADERQDLKVIISNEKIYNIRNLGK